jgi:MFS family permease
VSSDAREPRLFGDPAFRAYLTGVLSEEAGIQVVFIAVTWQIFLISHSPFDLGLVGLAMFLPGLLFIVFSGMIADLFDRRTIILAARGVELVCCGAFLALCATAVKVVWLYLAVAFVLGAARALARPADKSILPNIITGPRYVNAQAVYASGREAVVVGGPSIGGLLLTLSSTVAIVTGSVLIVVSLIAYSLVKVKGEARAPVPASWRSALAGLSFLRSRPIVFGAISLDLFAILFGGATALLPVYADTILHVGPAGLGYLRSAPSAGALLVALYMSRHAPSRRVGLFSFLAVAGFGAATIVFAYSTVLWLSLLALAVAGAFDVVGGVIRNGFIALNTPDEMRGRVAAIQTVFTSASNELGAFESGTLATFIGSVPAVALGGVASLVVAVLWTYLFPSLLHADRLTEEAA